MRPFPCWYQFIKTRGSDGKIYAQWTLPHMTSLNRECGLASGYIENNHRKCSG